MPKKKKNKNSLTSAKEVLEFIKAGKSPKKKTTPKQKDTGAKTTATSPKGIRKTPAQAAKEKADIRKKIDEKLKKAKMKKRKK